MACETHKFPRCVKLCHHSFMFAHVSVSVPVLQSFDKCGAMKYILLLPKLITLLKW